MNIKIILPFAVVGTFLSFASCNNSTSTKEEKPGSTSVMKISTVN